MFLFSYPMRKLLSLLFMLWSVVVYSQSPNDAAESVMPSYGVKLERPVAIAMINGVEYSDVVVELKAYEAIDLFSGVKVTIKDAVTGKKLYKKRFSKSRLYGFSDGSISIGKGNVLIQMILYKSKEYNVWCMALQEKGLY